MSTDSKDSLLDDVDVQMNSAVESSKSVDSVQAKAHHTSQVDVVLSNNQGNSSDPPATATHIDRATIDSLRRVVQAWDANQTKDATQTGALGVHVTVNAPASNVTSPTPAIGSNVNRRGRGGTSIRGRVVYPRTPIQGQTGTHASGGNPPNTPTPPRLKRHHQIPGCLFCLAPGHACQYCDKYVTSEERMELINKRNWCMICLSGTHVLAECRRKSNRNLCRFCRGEHHQALCDKSGSGDPAAKLPQ